MKLDEKVSNLELMAANILGLVPSALCRQIYHKCRTIGKQNKCAEDIPYPAYSEQEICRLKSRFSIFQSQEIPTTAAAN